MGACSTPPASRVGGAALLQGANIKGEVFLADARIAGYLAFGGGRFINGGAWAIRAPNARVGGNLTFKIADNGYAPHGQKTVIEGGAKFDRARIDGALGVGEPRSARPGPRRRQGRVLLVRRRQHRRPGAGARAGDAAGRDDRRVGRDLRGARRRSEDRLGRRRHAPRSRRLRLRAHRQQRRALAPAPRLAEALARRALLAAALSRTPRRSTHAPAGARTRGASCWRSTICARCPRRRGR